jgi:hypothetical protein
MAQPVAWTAAALVGLLEVGVEATGVMTVSNVRASCRRSRENHFRGDENTALL